MAEPPHNDARAASSVITLTLTKRRSLCSHRLRASAQRSVGLQGLGRYRSPNCEGSLGIMFGFGDVNEDVIRRGIAAIGDLLRQG